MRKSLLSLAVSTTIIGSGPAQAVDIEFNRDIRPILSDKCLRCHGPDGSTLEAGLRLDREESAKAVRDGNSAIVPGRPEESEVVRRIASEDPAQRMPPPDSGKDLSPAEIELLTRWIAAGARWQVAWPYVSPKPQSPQSLSASNRSWAVNWIDGYIGATLNHSGLAPSPDADKVTLIRRLSVDLTGLPPTPEEVDDFLAEDRPDAYERLVDRLLASPHYGERMAMYWFDLVRYADTVGYHGDQEHHSQAYREWVIDALNANKPFDRFTLEQLAGDLLPEPTVEQKIASGYNRILQTSHEGGVQPKEYLAIYAADHVRNLSGVWMGATLGCAQCHDHKFDPYTSKDFYSMAAFFADVDEAQHLTVAFDVSPTPRYPELDLPTADQKVALARLERRRQLLAVQLARVEERGDEAEAKTQAEMIAKCQAEIDAIRAQTRKTMITVSIPPREMRVLPRGNWLDESGEVVEPAIPAFLGKLDVGDRWATRLDLARWLTDANGGAGGLTARVMVNRFWYLLFGRGLCASLDDFGGQGESPDHPELLDALAIEFIDSGWDVKHMMKLIVMSRTYRQSSLAPPALRERDPLNKLVARQGRFRYPAESVRDAALSISGLLVRTVGGASAHPYQPAGYYRHLNFPEREYAADKNDNQWRRGVYMHWQRQYLHPMLKAFDAPTREECTALRARSNTAPAALVLLNDPSFVEAARAFAGRILQEGGSTTHDRLNFALRQAASRSATEKEQRILGNLLAESLDYYRSHPDEADQLLGVGLKPPPAELDHVELASWTILARATLNLNEITTRN